jgi:uncharacterized LabA/DUF88 family protein
MALYIRYTGAMKRNCYIDGNNLYRAAKELGFQLDYKRFRSWLRQKYGVTNVYLFIGLVPDRLKFYQHLQESGYILVFKQTITVGGVIKGNCDAELVLKVVSDLYTDAYDDCLIVTGDGDFGCLVEFLREKTKLHLVLAPDERKCSILLKNKDAEVTALNDLYHKFSTKI